MRYKLQKRFIDILLALVFLVLLAVPFACLVATLALVQGRPIFHASVRMRSPARTFVLWKLRTMRPTKVCDTPSGGHSAPRFTPFGKRLRQFRLDEIPQLWNILKGDMSFVGPRPPLPDYVASHPELFARVLRCRPGLTGLATLSYHQHEERLLSRCRTAEETRSVYLRRCAPRKARLDLIYLERQNIGLDLALLLKTAHRVFGPRPRKTQPSLIRLNGISTTLVIQ